MTEQYVEIKLITESFSFRAEPHPPESPKVLVTRDNTVTVDLQSPEDQFVRYGFVTAYNIRIPFALNGLFLIRLHAM